MTHFTCGQCGWQFKWKPVLAGKVFKCPCGASVDCPVDPIDETHNPYDLVDVPTPAPAARPVATVTAAPAPVQAVTGSSVPTLQYRSASVGPATPAEPEALKNFYIPIWLLAGGVAIEVVAALLNHRRGFAAALSVVGFGLIVGTPIKLTAVFITAKVRAIELGSFWTAALKLAAISVAPGAAGKFVGGMLAVIPLSGLFVWLGEFVLYFALLGLLFDMDESDTWYCVCVIFLLNLGLYFGLHYSGLF